MKERYWKYSLVILIIGLGILLFRQAQPFMNGILGGFTLFILLRNFTDRLEKRLKLARRDLMRRTKSKRLVMVTQLRKRT